MSIKTLDQTAMPGANPVVMLGFDARFPNQNQYAYKIPYFTMHISKEESNGQA